MIGEILKDALKDLGVKASGLMALCGVGIGGYLHLTTVKKSDCDKIHESTMLEFKEIREDISSVKVSVSKIEGRIEGIGARMQNHYENNNKQYLTILEKISEIRK